MYLRSHVMDPNRSGFETTRSSPKFCSNRCPCSRELYSDPYSECSKRPIEKNLPKIHSINDVYSYFSKKTPSVIVGGQKSYLGNFHDNVADIVQGF